MTSNETKMSQYDILLDQNKQALYKKLDNVRRCHDYLVCNDVINALSQAKERDKHILNNFDNEEIVICKVRVSGVLRECRCFTQKGIVRYLHEGKLYNYQNACSYFNVEPHDKNYEKALKQILACIDTTTQTFVMHKLLKWLFNKRKSIASFGDEISTTDLIAKLKTMSDVDMKKLKLFEKIVNAS